MENLSVALEIIMIVLFGASWPFNIVKAYKARSVKGTSLTFLLLILFGYAAGIVSKFVAFAYYGEDYFNYLRIIALAFYCVNFVMLSIALVIFFRNKKLDAKNKAKEN